MVQKIGSERERENDSQTNDVPLGGHLSCSLPQGLLLSRSFRRFLKKKCLNALHHNPVRVTRDLYHGYGMDAPNHCVALHIEQPAWSASLRVTRPANAQQRSDQVLRLHEIPGPDKTCTLSNRSLGCNTISRGGESIDSQGLYLQVIYRLAAGPIGKAGDGGGHLLAMRRPPQKNVGNI